jgi:hypothetical protein
MPKDRVGYRKIAGPDGLLAQREPFQGYTMAAYNPPVLWTTGQLNRWERERYEVAQHQIIYTVLSYGTPIAWITEDGQIYHVAQKFSVTTSKHQSYARAWLR